jgi:hypothetical protein
MEAATRTPEEISEAAATFIYGYPLLYNLEETAKFASENGPVKIDGWNTFGFARQLIGPDAKYALCAGRPAGCPAYRESLAAERPANVKPGLELPSFVVKPLLQVAQLLCGWIHFGLAPRRVDRAVGVDKPFPEGRVEWLEVLGQGGLVLCPVVERQAIIHVDPLLDPLLDSDAVFLKLYGHHPHGA